MNKTINPAIKVAPLALAVSLISACGGGSGGTPPSPEKPSLNITINSPVGGRAIVNLIDTQPGQETTLICDTKTNEPSCSFEFDKGQKVSVHVDENYFANPDKCTTSEPCEFTLDSDTGVDITLPIDMAEVEYRTLQTVVTQGPMSDMDYDESVSGDPSEISQFTEETMQSGSSFSRHHGVDQYFPAWSDNDDDFSVKVAGEGNEVEGHGLVLSYRGSDAQTCNNFSEKTTEHLLNGFMVVGGAVHPNTLTPIDSDCSESTGVDVVIVNTEIVRNALAELRMVKGAAESVVRDQGSDSLNNQAIITTVEKDYSYWHQFVVYDPHSYSLFHNFTPYGSDPGNLSLRTNDEGELVTEITNIDGKFCVDLVTAGLSTAMFDSAEVNDTQLVTQDNLSACAFGTDNTIKFTSEISEVEQFDKGILSEIAFINDSLEFLQDKQDTGEVVEEEEWNEWVRDHDVHNARVLFNASRVELYDTVMPVNVSQDIHWSDYWFDSSPLEHSLTASYIGEYPCVQLAKASINYLDYNVFLAGERPEDFINGGYALGEECNFSEMIFATNSSE